MPPRTIRRLYFAHPINVYDTPLETTLIRTIGAHPQLSRFTLENPNTKAHSAAYEARKTISEDAMSYFAEVVGKCAAVVFLAFPDGKIGGGVWYEILAADCIGLPLWEIFPDGRILRIKSGQLALTRSLTRIDTVARIRYPDGSPRPF